MKKILQKYNDYMELFNVKKSKSILLFEQLLHISKDASLECSSKIYYNKIYSERLNIWYNSGIMLNMRNVFNFIKKIQNLEGVNLNLSLFEKIIKKFDYKKIDNLICGIDIRPRTKESRVKIWFIIRDYPEKANEILNLHENRKIIKGFIHNNQLLFGIDFCFNGKTRLKVYPVYFEDELKEKSIRDFLKNNFNKKTVDLMNICERFHVSFKANDKIIHFKPRKPKKFLYKINNEQVKIINQKYENNNYSLQLISLIERELISNKLKEINLYY